MRVASFTVLIVVALAIPYLPYVHLLGFVPLSGALVASLVVITALYVLATELMKNWAYRETARA